MKKRISLLLTILTAFISCIEEYKISDEVSTDYQSELVIQGRILSGESSTFYISRTLPFGSENGMDYKIENAEITIIGKNGFKSEPATYDRQKEQYTIDTMNLPANTQYAVNILLEDTVYQSDFQELQTSPEIDAITYKENNDGISIHVSTHDKEDGSRAFMWTYEEDWEFHSDIDFVHSSGKFLYNNDIYPIVGMENPYLYCWGHQKSGNIHIYSTENLKENAVKEHELLQIPINDIRIYYIYSILVNQWVLNNEAYNYYKTLKLYSENMGGLFSPIPTEIDGNIKCISNPSVKVKGYVIAATIVEKRIFIYENDFQNINSEYSNCMKFTPANYSNWTSSWMEIMRAGNAVIYTTHGDLDESSILYYKECFDCRTVKESTKKRPDFWPNNHE